MKLGRKQIIAILERAFDKASKVLPGGQIRLADLENRVLTDCLVYSRHLASIQRRAYRDGVWQHYGWDQPLQRDKLNKVLEEIRYGKRIQ